MSEQQTLILESPMGPIAVNGNHTTIKSVLFIHQNTIEESDNIAPDSELIKTRNQLYEYFEGSRTEFDLNYEVEGSSFEKQVWKEVIKIPYGKTKSYSEIAENLNEPGAIRAIGRANAKNKLLIIIPCHRVIGKSGDLTGYAGGIETKKSLLEFEGAIDLQYSLF